MSSKKFALTRPEGLEYENLLLKIQATKERAARQLEALEARRIGLQREIEERLGFGIDDARLDLDNLTGEIVSNAEKPSKGNARARGRAKKGPLGSEQG